MIPLYTLKEVHKLLAEDVTVFLFSFLEKKELKSPLGVIHLQLPEGCSLILEEGHTGHLEEKKEGR